MKNQVYMPRNLKKKKSLGYKLSSHNRLLAQFLDYLEAAGATGITTRLAISPPQLPQGVHQVWAHRLNIVRGFASYMQAIDQATEVTFSTSATRAHCRRLRHRTCGRKAGSAGPDGGSPQAPASAPARSPI